MRKYPVLEYEECGFKMVEMNGSGGMRYEDYDDVEKVEGKHQREVVDAVREALGALEVVVCDYVVFDSFLFIMFSFLFGSFVKNFSLWTEVTGNQADDGTWGNE